MTGMIVAQHLAKRYGAVQAVDDVSFAVAEGEVVCLLGPNGAGKSTTVRMLTTLTRPDGGSARVAGYDVQQQPRQVRAAIGYVAQYAGTDAYLTGRENLLVQAAAQRLHRAAARRRTAELLDQTRLADAADRLVGTYSGGMRRRLEIAMGMVHQPRLLFLDEPTTGLDPEARAILWDQLAELVHHQRVSILLTTHYLEEADRLADRVVLIDQGKVVVAGTPAALKAGLAGDVLTIEIAGHPPAATVMAVASRGGVHDVSFDGSRLHARVAAGNRALPAMLLGLEAAGLHIQAASVAHPTLDDVYLHYTGHRIHVAVAGLA